MRRLMYGFTVGLMLLNTPFMRDGSVATSLLYVSYILGSSKRGDR